MPTTTEPAPTAEDADQAACRTAINAIARAILNGTPADSPTVRAHVRTVSRIWRRTEDDLAHASGRRVREAIAWEATAALIDARHTAGTLDLKDSAAIVATTEEAREYLRAKDPA